jgi:hypothetical protein
LYFAFFVNVDFVAVTAVCHSMVILPAQPVEMQSVRGVFVNASKLRVHKSQKYHETQNLKYRFGRASELE